MKLYGSEECYIYNVTLFWKCAKTNISHQKRDVTTILTKSVWLGFNDREIRSYTDKRILVSTELTDEIRVSIEYGMYAIHFRSGIYLINMVSNFIEDCLGPAIENTVTGNTTSSCC